VMKGRAERICWTVVLKTKAFVLSFVGVYLTAFGIAAVGAFFTLPAKNTWAERALNGVLTVLIALVLLCAVAFLRHLANYLRYRDTDKWIARAYPASNGMKVSLDARKSSDGTGEVSIRRCEVKLPDGRWLPLKVRNGEALIVETSEHGRYDVRWIGLQGRMEREVTRSCFALPEDQRVLEPLPPRFKDLNWYRA
jgi:hypothetical protein